MVLQMSSDDDDTGLFNIYWGVGKDKEHQTSLWLFNLKYIHNVLWIGFTLKTYLKTGIPWESNPSN